MAISKLNPVIRELPFGKVEIKKYPIYPLSVGDQLKLSQVIKDIIESYDDDTDDMAMFNIILDAITDNISTIIPMVSPELSVDEITNDQLISLAQTVWEVNFSSIKKKLQALFKKGKD